MTKAEFIKDIKDLEETFDCSLNSYEKAYKAQDVTDDEELAELAKTLVVSSDDFDFYLENSLDLS